MTEATQLKEMEDALEEANHCSDALEQLLREARDAGGATPDMFERIREANTHCEDAMQQYINRYHTCYDGISGK